MAVVRVGGWLCVLVAVVVVSVGGTGYFLVSMLLMVVVGSHLFRKQFSNRFDPLYSYRSHELIFTYDF